MRGKRREFYVKFTWYIVFISLLYVHVWNFFQIPEVLLWAKEQNEEQSPNLTEFTEHFNKMSYWCRTLVLQQEDSRDREKVLIKFIKIMKVRRSSYLPTQNFISVAHASEYSTVRSASVRTELNARDCVFASRQYHSWQTYRFGPVAVVGAFEYPKTKSRNGNKEELTLCLLKAVSYHKNCFVHYCITFPIEVNLLGLMGQLLGYSKIATVVISTDRF